MKSVRPFSGIHGPQQRQKKGQPLFWQDMGKVLWFGSWIRRLGIPMLAAWWVAFLAPMAMGTHEGHDGHSFEEQSTTVGHGYPIPGAPFKVFLDKGNGSREGEGLTKEQTAAAIQTVVNALSSMTRHRTQYQRFDEALTKDVLQKVIIEPRVYNREGKEFSFLVARTKHRGKVKLLISASALDEKGYLNQPEKLIPVLAREFRMWDIAEIEHFFHISSVLGQFAVEPTPRVVLGSRDSVFRINWK